jgi:mono/diheme cytochrome c family protein
MQRSTRSCLRARPTRLALLLTAALGLVVAAGALADLPDGSTTSDQVARGRLRVMNGLCADCHNRSGNVDPSEPNWLAGLPPEEFWEVGPFKVRPRNLTPDNATGTGRLSERQIFNALRYGLKPGDTPDVVITSNTPGQGNFPANPRYLAPPMPWRAFRHLPDEDLWAIVAYLKHGIKPVSNKIPASEGPPDFWASESTPAKIGPQPLPPYPADSEEFRP